jgi:hypothetical protein
MLSVSALNRTVAPARPINQLYAQEIEHVLAACQSRDYAAFEKARSAITISVQGAISRVYPCSGDLLASTIEMVSSYGSFERAAERPLELDLRINVLRKALAVDRRERQLTPQDYQQLEYFSEVAPAFCPMGWFKMPVVKGGVFEVSVLNRLENAQHSFTKLARTDSTQFECFRQSFALNTLLLRTEYQLRNQPHHDHPLQVVVKALINDLQDCADPLKVAQSLAAHLPKNIFSVFVAGAEFYQLVSPSLDTVRAVLGLREQEDKINGLERESARLFVLKKEGQVLAWAAAYADHRDVPAHLRASSSEVADARLDFRMPTAWLDTVHVTRAGREQLGDINSPGVLEFQGAILNSLRADGVLRVLSNNLVRTDSVSQSAFSARDITTVALGHSSGASNQLEMSLPQRATLIDL